MKELTSISFGAGVQSTAILIICGYEGTHRFPGDWECVAWKATGGYGAGRNGGGEENAGRERIWFSPVAGELGEMKPPGGK